ncbi:MAG: fibronectin type III domain-containing protein [Oscillospiraceae bacterium]|nr:fibronectin type III domain-containing protein [Oscillospiraceae bacterium]
MTKRLLALATALILAVSMLNLSVFADASVSAKIEDNGDNRLYVEWSCSDSATSYYTYSITGTATLATNKKTTETSTYVSFTKSGTYTLTVVAYDENDNKLGQNAAVTDATYLSSSTSGGVTFKALDSSTTRISWTANSNYESYSGTYVTTSGTVPFTTSTNYIDVPYAYSYVKSATVYGITNAGYQSSSTIASGSNNTSSSTSSNVVATLNSTVSTTSYYTVSWGSVSGATSYYLTAISSNGGITRTATTSSLYASGLALTTGYTYTITVYAYTTSGTVTVGSTSLVAGASSSSSSSSSGVSYYTTGMNSYGTYPYVLSWSAYSGATKYQVYINGSVATTVSATTTTAYLTYGTTYYVTIYALNAADTVLGTVGTATIVPGTSTSSSSTSGVTYTNNGTTTSGYYSYTFYWTATSGTAYLIYLNGSVAGVTTATSTIGTYTLDSLVYGTTYAVTVTTATGTTVGTASLVAGTSSSTTTSTSTTTSGTNCTVVSGTSTKTVTWTAYTGASYYVVTYYLGSNNSGTSVTVNGTATVLNIPNTTSAVIYIVPYSSTGVALTSTVWAYASVAATSTSTSSSSVTSTTAKNVSISSSTSSSTTITWDKVSGTSFYYIMYDVLGGSSGTEGTSMTNSFTLPFGKNASFQAYVYSISSTGSLTTIGYIYYVPGTSSSSSSSSTTTDTSSLYPTSFKATSGTSGKITLSWTAADDATSYTVYWKRSSATEWKKAGTIKKTAVSITGLKDGTSYDFYVVANTGYSSGTATITPSTKTSTVTATDPVSSSSKIASLTSVTSSATGSITVAWSSVSGATSYKVYVAEGSSTTYKCKATVTSGTSTTITGLTSGTTYKVRVVAVPYQTDLSTDLKACTYMSVTVK